MKPLFRALISALLVIGGINAHAGTIESTKTGGVIFENVRIFNGTSMQLSAPSNVLVIGNVIQTISVAPIAAPTETSVSRIQGGGRTLMPGLIDNHVHIFMAGSSQEVMMDPKATFTALEATASKEAELMLLRGFTAVRDVGGPVFGIKPVSYTHLTLPTSDLV